MENVKYEIMIRKVEDLTPEKIKLANTNFEKSMAEAIIEYAKQTGNLPDFKMGTDEDGNFWGDVVGFLE